MVSYLSFAVLLGILTGLYPSFVISRYRPIDTIGGATRKSKRDLLTKTLVVFQFSMSIVLIAVSVYMYQQMQFVNNMDLGYNHDNAVLIRAGRGTERIFINFKNELEQHKDIENITLFSNQFGKSNSGTTVNFEGNSIDVSYTRIDENFLNTMNIELVMGRNFNPDLITDRAATIIVNEKFVEVFGLQNPVGAVIPQIQSSGIGQSPKIIGVVKDFNFSSLKNEIEPLAFTQSRRNSLNYIIVKISPENVSGALSLLESTWKKVAPEREFRLSFMDDDLNRQYRTEQKWSKIMKYSTYIGIIISMLGLFALAEITTRKRIKEIGVRKVLGSSNIKIINLIFKDFTILLAFAVILSLPLILYVTDSWSSSFAFKINFGFSSFLITIGIAGLITLISVGYQSLKAASTNPVNSLRVE